MKRLIPPLLINFNPIFRIGHSQRTKITSDPLYKRFNSLENLRVYMRFRKTTRVEKTYPCSAILKLFTSFDD